MMPTQNKAYSQQRQHMDVLMAPCEHTDTAMSAINSMDLPLDFRLRKQWITAFGLSIIYAKNPNDLIFIFRLLLCSFEDTPLPMCSM